MLKIHWIEIFLRGIPESFLIIWGIYVMAEKPLNWKNYIISSISISLCIFFIRRLPIYWGIHTLILIILTISLMFIQGISLIVSMYGTMIMFLMLSLSEVLNILILNLLNIDINLVYIDSITGSIRKCILGIPSLIMVFLFIILIRYLKKQNISFLKI